jgi:eukaryotic-like serine/threonine-protein kinase
MAIQPGTRVGSYEIISAIGAGGMGEVYRARDAKLGRDVAIKVLPEAFARDPDRMARFEREAKVLASLDHPNIACIYGLEDSSGTRALVMQLVEGSRLADRIKAGPIPIDEAGDHGGTSAWRRRFNTRRCRRNPDVRILPLKTQNPTGQALEKGR